MDSVEILTQAIATTYNHSPEAVAAWLNGQGEENEYYEEMDRLASNIETSIEVLEAIEGYCFEHKDSDVQEGPFYFIEAKAIASRTAQESRVRKLTAWGTTFITGVNDGPAIPTLTIKEQVDELDWELPNLPDFEDTEEYVDTVVEAFEGHNKVDLDGAALEYFTESIEGYYNDEV